MNDDLLKYYVDELNKSKEWRKRHFEEQWKLYRLMYSHRDPMYCQVDGKTHRVQVNYVHSTINVIMASTLHRYPKITATARNAASFENSVTVEPVLNQQWQTKGWQRPHQLGLLDKLIFGHGWVKTTYQFTQKEHELSDAEFEARFDEEKKNAVAVFSMGKKPLPTDDEIRESIDKKGMTTLKDQVQVERVSPNEMFVDPLGKDMDSISWIAQEITVSRRAFEADERFPKKIRESGRGELDTNAPSNISLGEVAYDEEDTHTDYVKYVEFYDIVGGTISFFLSDGGEFLIKPKAMPYAFGQPFDMQRGNEVPDRFYPMGEVEIIADQQRELNELRSDIVNQRKKGNRSWLYKPDNVGPEFVDAMNSSEEEVLIPVDSDADFGDIVAELPFQARINPQLYDVSSLLQSDIFQLSGITDYQRGGGSSARTATQVAVENDASLARQARQLDAIEKSMARTATRALQLMQQFMTEQDVVRLSNVGQQLPEAENVEQRYHTVWYKFGPKDIGGEFDIAIEAGSTRPVNDSTRNQQALQLMNGVIPLIQSGVQIDLTQLATYFLREMGIPNPEAWIQGGSDPRAAAPGESQQVLQPPSVAGGVPPVSGQVQPQEQPGQNEPTALDAGRQQLAGQVGLN